MILKFKRNCFATAVTLTLCIAFVTAVHADVVITDGAGTSANIDDAGYFSDVGPIGYSFLGREFINNGTGSSNYWFNANGASVAIADEVTGSNPFGASIIASSTSVAVLGNLGFGGGWTFLETVSIPAPGVVAFQIQLTNNTGATAHDVQWGFGFDPNPGIPVGFGSGTFNTINATGNESSVSATSPDGWSIFLQNTTGASAFSISPYIDLSACCNPVDPAVMLAAAQGVGHYGFANNSINLAYDLGTIHNFETVTFSYAVSPIPEPEIYMMLLAGFGLIGFSARRHINT